MSWAQTWVHVEPLMYMLSNGNMIGKHWEQGKNMKICPLAKRESWTHHIYACWAFLLYHETLFSIIVHYHPHHIYVTQL
jgi:hypothetical protein